MSGSDSTSRVQMDLVSESGDEGGDDGGSSEISKVGEESHRPDAGNSDSDSAKDMAIKMRNREFGWDERGWKFEYLAFDVMQLVVRLDNDRELLSPYWLEQTPADTEWVQVWEDRVHEVTDYNMLISVVQDLWHGMRKPQKGRHLKAWKKLLDGGATVGRVRKIVRQAAERETPRQAKRSRARGGKSGERTAGRRREGTGAPKEERGSGAESGRTSDEEVQPRPRRGNRARKLRRASGPVPSEEGSGGVEEGSESHGERTRGGTRRSSRRAKPVALEGASPC
jgi:hypothetical protein